MDFGCWKLYDFVVTRGCVFQKKAGEKISGLVDSFWGDCFSSSCTGFGWVFQKNLGLAEVRRFALEGSISTVENTKEDTVDEMGETSSSSGVDGQSVVLFVVVACCCLAGLGEKPCSICCTLRETFVLL